MAEANSSKVDFVCIVCQTPFQRFPSEIRKGSGKYCSQGCYFNRKLTSALPRFLAKVDKNGPNGCWLWTAGATLGGYGMMLFNSRFEGSHRVAWQLFKGPIPEKIQVLHNCPGGDNTLCCNPEHLFLGTILDNRLDSVRKGRHARGLVSAITGKPHRYCKGSKNAAAKLTEEQAKQILVRVLAGEKKLHLSKEFGISRKQILRIVEGESSAHILSTDVV